MNPFSTSRFRLLAALLIVALGMAGCSGGDGPSTSDQPSTPVDADTEPNDGGTADQPTGGEAPVSDLPSVELTDVATGSTVNLAGYAPSDRAIVLWFWAPH